MTLLSGRHTPLVPPVCVKAKGEPLTYTWRCLKSRCLPSGYTLPDSSQHPSNKSRELPTTCPTCLPLGAHLSTHAFGVCPAEEAKRTTDGTHYLATLGPHVICMQVQNSPFNLRVDTLSARKVSPLRDSRTLRTPSRVQVQYPIKMQAEQ